MISCNELETTAYLNHYLMIIGINSVPPRKLCVAEETQAWNTFSHQTTINQDFDGISEWDFASVTVIGFVYFNYEACNPFLVILGNLLR